MPCGFLFAPSTLAIVRDDTVAACRLARPSAAGPPLLADCIGHLCLREATPVMITSSEQLHTAKESKRT
jgi:hypothetical protein